MLFLKIIYMIKKNTKLSILFLANPKYSKVLLVAKSFPRTLNAFIKKY